MRIIILIFVMTALSIMACQSKVDTSEKNKEVVRRWIEEVLNNRDYDVADEILSPDYVHNSRGEKRGGTGSDCFREGYQNVLQSFPDIHFTVEDIFAEFNKVVIRYSVTATHKGEWSGIAQTNIKAKWTGICIYKIVEGRIVEDWNEYDSNVIRNQLKASQ